jgi:hypothetical protein
MRKISIFLILSFTLPCCCDDDFIIPDYDFIEFAIDLTGSIDSPCSGPIYTTENATSDGDGPSCLDVSIHNRWFKFQASYQSIYVDIRVGGTEGTQLNSVLAIWDSDGTTQLDCRSAVTPDDDLFGYAFGLVIGEWYYISVDVGDANTAGTFGICIATD